MSAANALTKQTEFVTIDSFKGVKEGDTLRVTHNPTRLVVVGQVRNPGNRTAFISGETFDNVFVSFDNDKTWKVELERDVPPPAPPKPPVRYKPGTLLQFNFNPDVTYLKLDEGWEYITASRADLYKSAAHMDDKWTAEEEDKGNVKILQGGRR